MTRTQILNLIAVKINATRYLEIGVDNGLNFSEIHVSEKVGVDPYVAEKNQSLGNADKLIQTTSDDYFFRFPHPNPFDLVFIDGDHSYEQCYRDIINSIHYLSTGGVVVIHDCNPTTATRATPTYQGGAWNGECWRAFVAARVKFPYLNSFTIDTDEGLGVLAFNRTLYKVIPAFECMRNPEVMTYSDLESNRQALLDLITPRQFLHDFILA